MMTGLFLRQSLNVALRMLPMMEAEAKKRQGTRTDLQSDIQEILPESSKQQSRDQAAALVGVSGKYVSDIKSIEKNAPKFKCLHKGHLSEGLL